MVSCLPALACGSLSAFETIPSTVEDLVTKSDLIVLGRVVETEPEGTHIKNLSGVFTRHRFKVEAYYKGSGPEEITLATHGGTQTVTIEGEERTGYLQVTGAVGVSVDEEILAFLEESHGVYFFVSWDGAKYSVQTDEKSGQRSVRLRLRKKRYMRNMGLQFFEKRESRDINPQTTAEIERELQGTAGILETVAIEDVQDRLIEIIRGEATAPRR